MKMVHDKPIELSILYVRSAWLKLFDVKAICYLQLRYGAPILQLGICKVLVATRNGA